MKRTNKILSNIASAIQMAKLCGINCLTDKELAKSIGSSSKTIQRYKSHKIAIMFALKLREENKKNDNAE